MPGEWVIDASTMGAALFNEAGSAVARGFLAANPSLVAPDLIFAEIASLSAKKVWRDEATVDVGARALAALGEFIGEFAPSEGLAARAFLLASANRFSAYDSIYLALAESRETQLVTLDQKLVDRAAATGLGKLVMRPS
jgi:predicted nucleic acid-binding protein